MSNINAIGSMIYTMIITAEAPQVPMTQSLVSVISPSINARKAVKHKGTRSLRRLHRLTLERQRVSKNIMNGLHCKL